MTRDPGFTRRSDHPPAVAQRSGITLDRVRQTPAPVPHGGLSRRAQRFVEVTGVRVARQDVRRHREAWTAHGIPATEFAHRRMDGIPHPRRLRTGARGEGVTDSWRRGENSLIALYRGEAADLDAPQALENHAYEGVRA
ncbi:hypothetical protein ACFW0U_15850 [Streptomyces albidoflavus]